MFDVPSPHSSRVLFGTFYDHKEIEVAKATRSAVGMLATQAGVLGLKGENFTSDRTPCCALILV